MTRGDDVEVSRARERFLGGDDAEDDAIGTTILASWKRSRDNKVNADHLAVPYYDDWNFESPLIAAAQPVIDSLHQRLNDEPVSVILTDQSGLVLDRRVSERSLRRRLDKVSLAPGFSYAEEFVGTNGIGTALGSGTDAFIGGRAHYAGALGTFACAGVPIRHPVRGVTIGVLDLTTWSTHVPGRMLTALARGAAEEISEELLARTGRRESVLFHAYLSASRRPGAAVMALGSGTVMMTESMRLMFGSDEQRDLLGFAHGMLDAQVGATLRNVELSSGRRAHLRSSPVGSGTDYAGSVFTVRLLRQTAGQASRPEVPHHQVSPPGLSGSSPAWRRCVEQVCSCYDAREWFVLSGEPGTGKKTVLRAVHQQRNPTSGIHFLDPPEHTGVASWIDRLTGLLDDPATMVVIHHADALSDEVSAALRDRLQQLPTDSATSAPYRVAVTVTDTEWWNDALSILFPAVVEVPPLRHHLDDLPELASRLLGRAVKGGHPPTLSEAALAQLGRLDWPGNIAQLRDVIAELVKYRNAGTIDVNDLPAKARTSNHRRLTPIEALERDAIVEALLDNDQRPAQAASALGMSRATIYRKLRRYGISLPIT